MIALFSIKGAQIDSGKKVTAGAREPPIKNKKISGEKNGPAEGVLDSDTSTKVEEEMEKAVEEDGRGNRGTAPTIGEKKRYVRDPTSTSAGSEFAECPAMGSWTIGSCIVA